MIKVLKNIWTGIEDLIYPRVCYSCLEEAAPQQGSVFCLQCMFEIPYTNHFRLVDNELMLHFKGKLDLHFAAALLQFTEGGITQKILHNFKYRKMKDIGVQLGKIVADKLINHPYIRKSEVVIPVPLHDRKFQMRGYNQSEVFGKAIAEGLNLDIYTDVLMRKKFTETQTRKSKSERKENVGNAFEIINNSKIEGRHVILVDDVVTTGATIIACAMELLNSGAKSISVISLAKATH